MGNALMNSYRGWKERRYQADVKIITELSLVGKTVQEAIKIIKNTNSSWYIRAAKRSDLLKPIFRYYCLILWHDGNDKVTNIDFG